MRLAAVAAILIFVAWCAALALAGEPKLDAELAQARYYVAPPIASTVAATAAPPAAPIATVPTGGMQATVDALPVRGTAYQVTATVPPPAPVVIPHFDEWVALARCESGGDWSINTGNGYYGGLQFALTSWRGAGGLQYAAYPHQASAAQQMLTAERLLDMQGWGAWPTCSRRMGLR